MKILKTAMLVVMLLLVPVYALSANLGYMRISLMKGDVQIKTPEAGDWGFASVNTPLAEGDQVWAPRGGRVELQLNSGTYIRLDQDSALQILSLDKDSSQFYLSQGSAYIYFEAPRGSVIQVDTPDASTRAFDRAIFRIDMSEHYTDVAVYKGYVETENMAGATRINSGQMVSLGRDTDGELAPMGPPDAWERWNKTRNDRILARKGASSGYLPAELSAYSYDFDNSGRWVQVPEYGHVWTPTVSVGASWSPYRQGRWIWRGGDYVWVASEPWGWAPYHYGRWSFSINIGWFWVPPVAAEVYWSPGYVGWVRTADYVAWVPLAPGEIYYGRGNYGRHSVNITTVNINQVNINVYRNVSFNNGVTVVSRNTFASASPRIVNVAQDTIQRQIFTKSNISVGTPEIKPTRASYFASARSVPAANRPPLAVRNIQTTQLKGSRPLIKEADKSVLNPGIKPKTLPVKSVTAPRTPGKGKPGIISPGGPIGRGEVRQVTPTGRVKSIAPQDAPAARAEKKEIKPQERVKPVAPEGRPTGRVEKQQVKPEDKGKVTLPQAGPAGRAEKKEIKPQERVKPAAPEGRSTGGVEKQKIKPVEKKPVAPEGGREKKDKKPAELDESPQKDKKKLD